MPAYLDTVQKDRDCTLTQIERRGAFAVFARTKEGKDRGYEVVQIRYQESGKLPSGGMSEAGEKYPTSGSWGRDGISVPTLEEAIRLLGQSVILGKVATTARMQPPKKVKPVKKPRKKK